MDKLVAWLLNREPYPLLKRRLYQMRSIELLEELFLLDPGYALPPLTRDALISEILNYRDLLTIECVDCPVCWTRPRRPCFPSVTYISGQQQLVYPTKTELLRPYHTQRRVRAIRKVGL